MFMIAEVAKFDPHCAALVEPTAFRYFNFNSITPRLCLCEMLY